MLAFKIFKNIFTKYFEIRVEYKMTFDLLQPSKN